jgi:hypothetical protein
MKDHIVNFAKSLRVYDTELTKKRIGREEDGGYVILDEACKLTDVLYSYGVSDDWSFEEDFCNRYKCKANLYDHTVDLTERSDQKLVFRKEGLSSYPTPFTNTIRTHISTNSDQQKKLALKLDIEWNEWDFFESLEDEILEKFVHIVCEFHLISVDYPEGKHTPYFTGFHKDVYNGINQVLFEKYTKVFEKIKRYHVLHHVHVNNSLSCLEYKECRIPYILECSFVNKNLVSLRRETEEKFPLSGLDFPNKPYKEEIRNFYPLFNGK